MDRAWYFVSHLIAGDIPDATRPFEVQVLNEVGQGVEVGYFAPPCSHLVIAGREVPPAVLEAAARLPVGFGFYVGSAGDWLDGCGQPGCAAMGYGPLSLGVCCYANTNRNPP